MSRWDKKFREHPIHETLIALREGASTEFQDVDVDEIPEKRRFLKVISCIEGILERLDPELIHFNYLDELNNHVAAAGIRSQIEAYATKGDVKYLEAANNSSAVMLPTISAIASMAGTPGAEKAVHDLQDIIDTSIESLVEKKDALQEKINEIGELARLRADELEALESRIEQATQRAQDMNTDWHNQFLTAQESRSNTYIQWRESFIQEANEALESAQALYRDKILEYVSDAKEKHGKILELYELTAGDSVGSGYMKSAKDEGDQANTWRRISVGFILLSVLFLGYNFFSTENINAAQESTVAVDDEAVSSQHGKPFSWYRLLLTFSMTGVLLWGSAYSAQQSTKHRRNEKRAKWFALEIKAIEPYVQSFDHGMKMEIKKNLSEKMFGRAHDLDDHKDNIVDEHALGKVLESLTEAIKKIKIS